MVTKKFIVFIVSFVLFSVGCASHQVSPYLDYNDQMGFTSPSLGGDLAVVVFLRPDFIPVYAASIIDGEEFITILTDQTHFVYETAPGDHRFMAHVTRFGPSYVDAELAAGKIYFIAVKKVESTFRAWIQLIPITPDSEYWGELNGWMSQSRLVQPNTSAQKWFEQHRPQLLNEQENRNAKSLVTKITAVQGVDRVP